MACAVTSAVLPPSSETRARHFCGGGDAPASVLCLPQVTPVQLRGRHFLSEPSRRLSCLHARLAAGPLFTFPDYSSGCCALSAPDRAWVPRSTDGVGTPLSSVPSP